MRIKNLIDKLNNELDKINESNNIDSNSFFTNDKTFNDDISLVPSNESNNNLQNDSENYNFASEEFKGKFELDINKYKDIEPDDKTKDLVSIKEKRFLTAQNAFKKSIKISIKSFLISLSLSFLNLFI